MGAHPLLLFLGACDKDSGVLPPNELPSAAVIVFVQGQDVPDIHSNRQRIKTDEVECFSVEYGPPMDCPSGCVYHEAVGLRVGSKIGWLSTDPQGYFTPETASFFDVESSDTALFNVSLWDRLDQDPVPQHFLWAEILPTLAGDTDTATSALIEIVKRLRSYIVPAVAYTLVENPVVQSTEAVLLELVQLPTEGGAYSEVVGLAQELLEALGE